MTNKKLRSGMSLIEVIIAMSIFSLMTLAITMAFAACMRYNKRNVKRDFELNVQQTALEKGDRSGIRVIDDTFTNRKTITFTTPGGDSVGSDLGWDPLTTDVFSRVAQYKAINSALNKDDIDFQIKTFSSTNLGGSATPAFGNPDDNLYTISFGNLSMTNIDVRIEMNNGTVAFTGDYYGDGYVIRSPLYSVSLAGGFVAGEDTIYEDDEITGYDADGNPIINPAYAFPTMLTLGLKMDEDPNNPGVEPYITVKILENGSIKAQFTVAKSSFNYYGRMDIDYQGNGNYDVY